MFLYKHHTRKFMKNKIYLSITLLIILIGLNGYKSKDARIIAYFGSEKQTNKMYTPLIEEKFNFSKLGNKETYEIYPKYFGMYSIYVKITDNISMDWKEMSMYPLYFTNCIKIKISVENKIIYNKVLKKEELSGKIYTSTKEPVNMGVILSDFEIKKEYIDKKTSIEIKVINTNENLIRYINRKKIVIKVAPNM